MAITMKRIIEVVHAAMEKGYKEGYKIFISMSSIHIRRSHEPILDVYVTKTSILIETLNGRIGEELSSSDRNLFNVLMDEIKNYSSIVANNEFFDLEEELDIVGTKQKN